MSNKKKSNPFQDPCNLEVSEDHRQLAKQLMADKPGGIAVRYVRSGTSARFVRDEKDRPRLVVDRGIPTGCVVAFAHNGEVKIGWSSRNVTESGPSTKKGALYTAILRALTDNVHEVSSKTHQTEAGRFVPKSISREMPSFLTRVKAYLKAMPDNYVALGKAAKAAKAAQ